MSFHSSLGVFRVPVVAADAYIIENLELIFPFVFMALDARLQNYLLALLHMPIANGSKIVTHLFSGGLDTIFAPASPKGPAPFYVLTSLEPLANSRSYPRSHLGLDLRKF